MDKFFKLFILMPEKGDLKKFIWSIVFYAFVPSIAASIATGLLFWTVVGLFAIPAAGVVYTVFGLVLALLHFIGYEFPAEEVAE